MADWLESSRAKTLRVSNERESIQFTKLSHSLDSMRLRNNNLLQQEERKIKRNLAKLTDVSNVSKSGLSGNIYKKPSGVVLFENQRENTQHNFVKVSDGASAALSSDHLPNFFRFHHQPVFGINNTGNDPTSEKRLKELFFKAWQEENFKRPASSYIPPDDVLRCRYLRLSESNIASLLQKYKDSGIHVAIHPHMKESDIDISTVMSSENINTVSL
ncbi:uncharacterized protein C16orf78 homolog [Rhinoderma darwinii]|uniref:uncharacterized protein C16orf78 homolog n=1 Tax=Rhinoderma darwinii TaxID=43563 RepID=UPI003F66E8F8